MTRRYAVIVGQGRSGSNWLLNLFDLSPDTFCRDEPDLLQGSPLGELRRDQFLRYPDQQMLHEKWDDAIDFTMARMGAHDNPIVVAKRYIYELPRQFGIYRAVRGPRLRRLWGHLLPSFRKTEWLPPSYLVNRRRFQDSFAILKFVSPPGWASFVLTERPQVPVFHVLRHPGGFLNSWANRYLADHHETDVLRANLERLHKIAVLDDDWSRRFGEIDNMDVFESELWYWLYVNEEISRVGKQSSRFTRVVFEDLTQDAVNTMGPLYENLNLPFEETVQSAIASSSTSSRSISLKWREHLSLKQQRLVEMILVESSFRNCWDNS